MAQSSLTYTPPQKKGNFRKVAVLLGKSVGILLVLITIMLFQIIEEYVSLLMGRNQLLEAKAKSMYHSKVWTHQRLKLLVF